MNEKVRRDVFVGGGAIVALWLVTWWIPTTFLSILVGFVAGLFTIIFGVRLAQLDRYTYQSTDKFDDQPSGKSGQQSNQESTTKTQELERLADLKDRGVLSEEEFEEQKQKLLNS